MMDKKLNTLGELSERMNIPMAWLRREADAGRIPCLRAGRRRLFNPEAVERALAEKAAQGAECREGGR